MQWYLVPYHGKKKKKKQNKKAQQNPFKTISYITKQAGVPLSCSGGRRSRYWSPCLGSGEDQRIRNVGLLHNLVISCSHSI